ncbi:MAG: hypothetical protein BWZ10_03405 [candidate division BRC1 bacterium ADurb.BinA364]|nr:MAG: hypothetical protein BWZ10_03405 [candidate division BRC1 bacterium ADurb.BinA364]
MFGLGASGAVHEFAAGDRRQSETADPDVSAFVDQQGVQIEIAVQHAAAVGAVEGLANPPGHLQHGFLGQRPIVFAQQLACRFRPFGRGGHIFHGLQPAAAGLGDFVSLDDKDAVQANQAGRLGLEPFGESRALAQRRRKHAQSQRLARFFALGQIHIAQGALAQQALQAKIAQSLALQIARIGHLQSPRERGLGQVREKSTGTGANKRGIRMPRDSPSWFLHREALFCNKENRFWHCKISFAECIPGKTGDCGRKNGETAPRGGEFLD